MVIKWNEVIPQAIEQAQGYRNEYGEAPTLRAIYYRLVSIEAIPNTRSAYKGLSKCLSEARKDGAFPWRLLQDKQRGSVGRGSETRLSTVISWAESEVRDSLTGLEHAFEKISDPSVHWNIGKWDGQPKRVVIALEKEAVSGAVQSVSRAYGIEIFPMKGYSSTTFMKEMADRLSMLDDEYEVQLLIITDYDPSGEDISRHVQDELRNGFGVVVEAEKILLNKDQILEHNLPAIPEDAEERAKMARDPRFANWEDGFYRVELDAMSAIVPSAFRACIVEAIEKHYDADIYEERKAKAQEAFDRAEGELRGLYEQLEEVHGQVLDRIAEIRGEGTDTL